MDTTKVGNAQAQDKLLAQQKKFEHKEAKRALRDQHRARMNEVFENEKAAIDMAVADRNE